MTDEDLRFRSLYVLRRCEALIQEASARLRPLAPPQGDAPAGLIEHTLRRELGLLFRYWATHDIWDRLEAQQEDAKRLNISVLRLFIEAFKLPRDGSGLRYAELGTLNDTANELAHRLRLGLGGLPQPLTDILQASIRPWKEAVGRAVQDALARSLDEVQASVTRAAER